MCVLTFLHPNMAQNFDTVGQKITFYPASMVISHNSRPLIFYNDTKLVNVMVQLEPISSGSFQPLSNGTCSSSEPLFFNLILTSIREIQKDIGRLLSLPGFSNLIECTTYLPRFYSYQTGLPTRMSCPRGYRISIQECKAWALDHCRGFTTNERAWLKQKKRIKRSWMCHAGVFGLFRKIYEWSGRKCEPNHVVNLKSTMKSMLRATKLTQSLIHQVNGKVIYLIKTTDTITTKLNILSTDLQTIDKTFSKWKKQLDQFSNTADCHHALLLEFLSKYSAEINRAFTALLRLSEIQDLLSQVSHLSQKTLIGFADLPRFITDRLSFNLKKDSTMEITVDALEQGFSVLALPMVDYEYQQKHLELNILVSVPEITSTNHLCTIEHLSPISINISGTCYTRPVTQKDLVLITCESYQKLITTEALNKCFKDDTTVLCPSNVLQTVSNIDWLGFPWNADQKLAFPRTHIPAEDCQNLQPIIHLGGRYFLATTQGTLNLNTGTLELSPLTIYHFPCNVSFAGMKTGLSQCPDRLEITVPLFAADTIQYVPWKPYLDPNLLELHYQSLAIPPPTTLNKTVRDALDQLYRTLDQKLTHQINKADHEIDSIQEVSETSLTEILTYVALGLSIMNTIAVLTIFCLLYNIKLPRQKACKTCNKMLRKPKCDEATAENIEMKPLKK